MATMDAQVGPILSAPNGHVKGDFTVRSPPASMAAFNVGCVVRPPR